MIEYTCPCGKKYQQEDRHAGQPFSCGTCGAMGFLPALPVAESDSKTVAESDSKTVSESDSKTVPESDSKTVPEGDSKTAADQTIEFTPAPQSDGKSDPRLEVKETPIDSEYAGHRIVRPHAKGGMGKVSIAVDESLKREVALKELFEHAAGNDTAVRRFLDEAEITARLEHPGIVPVHAFGLDSHGRPFYTMKLIRGKTLQQAIKDYHRVAETAPEKHAALRDLLRRFASVCQTMEFAHERGILHRDLKPANIMLGEHGETLVMDWGLAKPMEEGDDVTLGEVSAEKVDSRLAQTESGNVIGTPAYMSPEQASGEQGTMGPRSDIYSLGAILYQILTDKTPHSGKSSDEIIRKVLAEQPHRVSEMNRFAPKALEAIAMRALARDPKERYSDAWALYRDVMNWLDDEPLEARPDTRYDKLWRWIRKNRALATTLFISTLLLLTILGTAGILLERARTQTVAAEKVRDEMKSRADAARAQAKKLAAELETKEAELAQAKAALLASTGDDEEKARLRKRVQELIVETGALRTKITRLETIATEFDSGSHEAVTFEPVLGTSVHYEFFDINRMTQNRQARVFGFDTSWGTMGDLLDLDDRSTRGHNVISKNVNPAVITLFFARPQQLSGLSFAYTNDVTGTLRVEAANSLDDLEQQANSYALLMPGSVFLPTGDDFALNAVQFHQPVKLTVLRLTFHNVGEDEETNSVYLNRLRFWGAPNYEEVTESPEIDFEVKGAEGGVELVRYTGNEEHVAIPAMIGGKAVVKIGNKTFDNSPVKTVTTPETLIWISEFAFSNCPLLQEIRLSKNVAELQGCFINNCPQLQVCELDKANPHFRQIDGVIFSSDMKSLMFYPSSKEGPTYTVPAGVKHVARMAFGSNRHLVSVVLPEGVEEIDWQAFAGAGSLVEIHLPESVHRLEEACFAGCVKLEKINVPDKVTGLGRGTFIGCASLKTFMIPRGVIGIAGNAFEGCTALENFYVAAENSSFSAQNGVLFSEGGTVLYRYPQGKPETSFEIPTGVVGLAEKAFIDAKNLTSLKIPEGVKWIGTDGLRGCQALESLVFPESLEGLGGSACRNCGNLKSVKIPGRLGHLPNDGFHGCISLTTVEIAEGLNSIGDNTFLGCTSLTSITLPKSFKTMDAKAFTGCVNLAEITIPGMEVSIYEEAFIGCDLEKLTIRGQRGSTVEAFAEKQGIKFVPLEAAQAK